MAAPPGYDAGSLTYEERNPQTIQIADGVRSRKTDDGYVLEVLQPDNTTWKNVDASGQIIPRAARPVDIDGIVDILIAYGLCESS
jgi:hypothetical protein